MRLFGKGLKEYKPVDLLARQQINQSAEKNQRSAHQASDKNKTDKRLDRKDMCLFYGCPFVNGQASFLNHQGKA